MSKLSIAVSSSPVKLKSVSATQKATSKTFKGPNGTVTVGDTWNVVVGEGENVDIDMNVVIFKIFSASKITCIGFASSEPELLDFSIADCKKLIQKSKIVR